MFFFFNDTATTEIYTLSLHDALPISHNERVKGDGKGAPLDLSIALLEKGREIGSHAISGRSEEHTSELQSPCNLVCRLLLEKKKNRHTCRFCIIRSKSLLQLRVRNSA